MDNSESSLSVMEKVSLFDSSDEITQTSELCEAMAFMLIFVDSTLPFTGEVTVEYSTWVS